MVITAFSRLPLLVLLGILVVALIPSALHAADKKPDPPPTGPLPTMKNSNWSVAWRDGEGVAVKGRLSFSGNNVSSSELGMGDVTYNEKGAWSAKKPFKAKITFNATGKDKGGNPLTMVGEVNDKTLTATVTIKAKDGEKKLVLAGSH